MIVRRSDMMVENKEKMRDGEGITQITHFASPDTQKNARLVSEITLQPGASIGYHQHDAETEYYLIISGTGLVDDNGAETEVKQGDAVITGNGAYHSIKNTGNVPLVFHAIIVTY
ncbi:MAG: cupin domain-containing protein [Treponema sp.]|nr:cupin domain-containing protein [Treponema sp.]